MPNENNFEIRDIGDGDWYWVNRSVIFDYAGRIRGNGIMVYSFLACHVDRGQSCFPSQKYMSERLGCSRATVSRTLKELERHGLIRRERLDMRHCAYHLLKVGCPEMKPSEGDGFTGETHGARDEASGFHRGDTNYNDLSKDINNIGIDSVTNPNMGTDPLTREGVIAHDMAKSLNDPGNMDIYLSYARRLPESFLRGILGDVMEITDERIRKSRAALFNHIVNKHINKHARDEVHRLRHLSGS